MIQANLILLGFGNVGRALARLLLAKRETLRNQYGIEWQVVGIATQKHGVVLDPNGIRLDLALKLAESNGDLSALSEKTPPADSVSFITDIDASVLFENTPVNYLTGQPAIDHIKTALHAGMHAITANKGPVVHAYKELTELARAQGVRFLFESTVMDGAPIFSLWREALPAAGLHAFRGILNSTTNLILTMMEKGHTFSEAVAYAQSTGIAETDPSGDIEGWDAAIKVAALVTVLMGIPLKPNQVKRIGIESLSLNDVNEAQSVGQRWKLVCQAKRCDQIVEAEVSPQQIDSHDPLYHVMGTSSAITFQSDVLGDLTIFETNPGPHTTAYGLLADFIHALNS